MFKISISNFLKEKHEGKKVQTILDLKKYRNPTKIIIDKNKKCPTCDKHKFEVLYKRCSNDILAYKCDFCGDCIYEKEKKEKVIEDTNYFVEDTQFKCPLGGVEYCVKDLCTYYCNICKIKKENKN